MATLDRPDFTNPRFASDIYGSHLEAMKKLDLNIVAVDAEMGGSLNVVTAADDAALTAAQSGSVVLVTGVDKVITLPATAAGLTYTIVTMAVSASTGTSISPAAADKIVGNGQAGTDDKDTINTGATDVLGDLVTVVGDGGDGWVITNIIGTWAEEA